MRLNSYVVAVFAALASAPIGAPLNAQESRPAGTTAGTAVVAKATDSATFSLRPDASTARTRSMLGLQRRGAPVPPPIPGAGGLSKSEAMMVVGGVALILGAVIGDDEGTIIMVGGAVIGLIGLWRWLQ